jgi:hydroxyethylthiazole kinase-like uncharacterized protein yjeF
LDNAHKYQRGVVAIHAGSTEYPGAGVLAAAGARFSGVGLVTVIGGAVSAITERFPEVVARELDQRVGAIAVGSGDSISKSELVELLATDIPLVVDAGALSFLSDAQVKEQLQARAARGAVTVLTPHEGEAKKLGVALDDRYAAAQLLANDYSAIVVLKGPGTVISAPNEIPFVDSFGTKALATAGSGDVLAGLIAAALASWPEIGAHRVVASAVALHGLAGRLAPHNSPALEIAQSLPLAYATI